MNTIRAFMAQQRSRWSDYYSGRTTDWVYILKTPRFRASRHVVAMICAKGTMQPVFVAKIPRLPGDTCIEREAASLRAVQALRPAGFDSIPHCVAIEKYRGISILLQTALPGPPIDPARVRRDRAACCQRIVDWLCELHTCRPVADADTTHHSVDGLMTQLAQFADQFPLSAKEEWMIEHTQQCAAALAGAKLPAVFEHGDLSHPNLLHLPSGQVGVLDWELAQPHGMPACDLFFALMYVASSAHRARSIERWLAAYHEAFVGSSAWSRRYWEQYCEQVGLPVAAFEPLLPVCWFRYVARTLARFMDDAGTKPSEEVVGWIRENRYYRLWQDSLTHRT